MSRFWAGRVWLHDGKAAWAVVMARFVSEIEALLKLWRMAPVAGFVTGKERVVV